MNLMKKLPSYVVFLKVYSGFYPAFMRKVLFQSFRKLPAEQICVCRTSANLPLSKFTFAELLQVYFFNKTIAHRMYRLFGRINYPFPNLCNFDSSIKGSENIHFISLYFHFIDCFFP